MRIDLELVTLRRDVSLEQKKKKGLIYNKFKKKWRTLEICSKEEQKNGVGV